jgi:hypothetical protein
MYDEQAGKADTGLGKDDFGWGSPLFHKMGRQKVDLARTFTDFGLDLCLCDVDTVWINDPTKYFERYPDADILASSDDLTPSNPKGDDGLEQLESIHSAMNIGGLRDALEGICVGPAVLWYRHACSAACTASMEWPACDKVVLPLQACSSSATPRTPPTSSTHGSSSWMPTPKWGHGGAGRMAFTCLVCTGVELLVAALLH